MLCLMCLRKVTASLPSIKRWSYVSARYMMGLHTHRSTWWWQRPRVVSG
jgi:hypothetical protein